MSYNRPTERSEEVIQEAARLWAADLARELREGTPESWYDAALDALKYTGVGDAYQLARRLDQRWGCDGCDELHSACEYAHNHVYSVREARLKEWVTQQPLFDPLPVGTLVTVKFHGGKIERGEIVRFNEKKLEYGVHCEGQPETSYYIFACEDESVKPEISVAKRT